MLEITDYQFTRYEFSMLCSVHGTHENVIEYLKKNTLLSAYNKLLGSSNGIEKVLKICKIELLIIFPWAETSYNGRTPETQTECEFVSQYKERNMGVIHVVITLID